MVETYGYQRKTSRQHRQIYKVSRPRFNLLLVSDDSCMKTCERSRRLRAAELNPLQPAAVCAESTPQPNEGIYSAAQTCGRGQRTINSDPQTWWTYSSQHRPVKRYYIWNMTCLGRPQFICIWCLHRNLQKNKTTALCICSVDKRSASIPAIQIRLGTAALV